MKWNKHCYRVGSHSDAWDDLPAATEDFDKFVAAARKRVEPWLSAVFQAEHLNLVLGSGFTTAIGYMAGAATGMAKVKFGTPFDAAIDAHADSSAKTMGRGRQHRRSVPSALAVLEGFAVVNVADAGKLKTAMNAQLKAFLDSLLAIEVVSQRARTKSTGRRRRACCNRSC